MEAGWRNTNGTNRHGDRWHLPDFNAEAWGFPITLNQFLVAGDHPALIHTGTFPVYEDVRKAIAEVLDPSLLEYIVITAL